MARKRTSASRTRPPRAGNRAERLVLGLMSGTSADGIDAACVRIRGRGLSMGWEFLWHHHRPYPGALRRRLLAVMAPAATRTEEVATLDADIGEAFAAAAVDAIRRAPAGQRPAIIGLAGQTVCHLPGRRHKTVTWQLGEPARVAERTGATVVAHFRQSDVAAGGQGAPLVPWTDWVLLRDRRVSRAVQNIGGIGNVTWLPAGCGPEEVVAFDTGPGNMIIDGLCRRVSGGKMQMDRGGRLAASGRVLPGVLAAWMRHPFLARKPPKTTGREMFGEAFLDGELPRLRAASPRAADWVATATAFTAESIARACRRFRGDSGADCQPELVLCGGGARNPALRGMLSTALPGFCQRTIDDLGIPTEAKEAVSFAVLAAARLDGVPGNLPAVTGAGGAVVLGAVYPGN